MATPRRSARLATAAAQLRQQPRQQQQKGWRKVLHWDQGLPDNYVDPSFLSSLRLTVPVASHADLFVACVAVGQRVASVGWLLLAFAVLADKDAHTAPAVVLVVTSTVLALCLLRAQSGTADVRSLVMLAALLLGLAPALLTLSETISSDTLYLMTAVMLLANLALADYGPVRSTLRQAASLNAGTFASVCLASRLSSAPAAFALVWLALVLFGVWPSVLRRVQDLHPRTGAALGLASMAACSLLAGVAAQWWLAWSLAAFLAVLMSAGPLLLRASLRRTRELRGPWDEAAPPQPSAERPADTVNGAGEGWN